MDQLPSFAVVVDPAPVAHFALTVAPTIGLPVAAMPKTENCGVLASMVVVVLPPGADEAPGTLLAAGGVTPLSTPIPGGEESAEPPPPQLASIVQKTTAVVTAYPRQSLATLLGAKDKVCVCMIVSVIVARDNLFRAVG